MTIRKHFKEKVFHVTFFLDKAVCTRWFFIGEIHDGEILLFSSRKKNKTKNFGLSQCKIFT